jgi:hypothetical protein
MAFILAGICPFGLDKTDEGAGLSYYQSSDSCTVPL